MPFVLAIARGPPDPARSLVRYHARPDRLARRACRAVEPALGGIELPEHDAGTVAARRHLADTFARVIGIGTETPAGIVCRIRVAQFETGFRYYTDAAPVRVDHVHDVVEMPARPGIAARPDDLRVAVVEKMTILAKLPQHRVERSEQRIGREAGHGGGNVVLVDDELPFLGSHDGRNMARRDQRTTI